MGDPALPDQDGGTDGALGSAFQSDGNADALLVAVKEAFTTVGEASGTNVDLLPISDFYPGDDYLDYFAISCWGDFWPDSRVQLSPETHALWEDWLCLPRYQPLSELDF